MSAQHWLAAALATAGAPLAANLTQMLDEHPSHRTERRGCGFTQATRVLSGLINATRSPVTASDLTMFANISPGRVEAAAHYWIECGRPQGWRQLQSSDQLEASEPFAAIRSELIGIREALTTAVQSAPTPEVRILLGMMIDILDRTASGVEQLPPMTEKPEIGSCSQAEEFFLEIAHGKVRRGGSVNVIADRSDRPLLIEKMNLGESHSAVSVEPLILNGVRLPPGSLFALAHAESALAAPETGNGRWLSIDDLKAARFLRLTTLSAPPDSRRRVFSSQVELQVRSNMVSPLSTTLEHLARFADACAGRAA